MHLHEYVHRKFANATRERSVHEDDDFAREYERPPPAASTPEAAGPAALIAEGRPELAPHDRPVLGSDQNESGAARRLEPPQLGAELPAPPHRLHHAPRPGLIARLPRHRDRV